VSSPSSRAIAVIADNKYIIAGGGEYSDHPGYLKFWHFTTGEFIRNDPWKHYVLSNIVALPDDHSFIVHGRDDHTFLDGTQYVYLGDIEAADYQLVHKWTYHETDLAFIHHRQNHIGFDRHVFDLQTKRLAPITPDEEKKIRQRYGNIEITPGHRLLSNDETFVIEDKTGRVVQTFAPGHGNKYHNYSPKIITPDGRWLLAQRGSDEHGQGSTNKILSMWEMQTGALVTSFETCRGTIQALDSTSDNQYAVVYVLDPHHLIRVINLQTGALSLELVPES
jgi:hypothetical protein